MDGNPFLDPEQVRGQLYERADRLTLRSGALNRARTDGRYVPEVIVELAVRWYPTAHSTMSRTSVAGAALRPSPWPPVFPQAGSSR
ncbi:MAG: hypothetical protein ACRDQ9_00295 [Pseudonocardiaceae bacterium]